MAGSGEWLGVAGAARSSRQYWWDMSASGWCQARSDAVGTVSYKVVSPKRRYRRGGRAGTRSGVLAPRGRTGRQPRTLALWFHPSEPERQSSRKRALVPRPQCVEPGQAGPGLIGRKELGHVVLGRARVRIAGAQTTDELQVGQVAGRVNLSDPQHEPGWRRLRAIRG